MDFINPPPFDDESDSPSYDLNDVITVRWTEVKKGTATSLTLWQLNSTTRIFFGDMEYITNNVLENNSFRWIVATSKNLTVSNLFFLSIFEEGKTASDSNSLPFIIQSVRDDGKESDAVQDGTSTLTNSAISTTSTPTSTPINTPISTPTRMSTSTPNTATTDTMATDVSLQDANDTGLSNAGKIAIGTAIPLFIILAIAGFFLLKWRRKGRERGGQPVTTERQPSDLKDPGYKMNFETQHWRSYTPLEENRRWKRAELPGSEMGQTTRVYELETFDTHR